MDILLYVHTRDSVVSGARRVLEADFVHIVPQCTMTVQVVTISRLKGFFRCSRVDSIAFVCTRRTTVVGAVVLWLFMVLRF